jgi:hypothetical protein
VSERPGVVRSYQRVFRPDRRIYAVDGRTLPVPGGIPLRWLATASIVVVAGALVAALSPAVIIAGSVVVGWSVARTGRRGLVPVVSAAAAVVLVVVGVLIGLLDWPLRFVVLPAAFATALTQLSPDGRGAHRFAWSWLRVRVAGRRHLGQPMARTGQRGELGGSVPAAADSHRPQLARAVITGPGRVRFAGPVVLQRGRRGSVARPLDAQLRARGVMVDRLELGDGERLRVRP